MIIFPNQARNICSIPESIKGIYRYFSDSNELLPDGAGIHACEAFTRGHSEPPQI